MAETNRCRTSCASGRRTIEHWLCGLAAAALLLLCGIGTGAAFDSGLAGFSVRVHGTTIPYRVFAIYVLPGEKLDIVLTGDSPAGNYRLRGGGRLVRPAQPGRWQWTAPGTAGIRKLTLDRGKQSMQLNVVVMYPAGQMHAGRLRAYRIGHYPTHPLNGNPIYRPPGGFIELDARDASLRLSPHFRLRQFPAKQVGGPPRFLVLRERLLLKLELLLDRLNAAGRHADTLTVMSGYRTPSYNAALGNVEYSRHVYGGAADIYVDSNPHDGNMDDLNRDGIADYRDAQWLYRLANALFSAGGRYAELAGGLGVYRSTRYHGPFVHIDARGTRARWGLIPVVAARPALP